MVHFVLAILVVIGLSACSTPLKLDNIPVEDRAGVTTGALARGAGAPQSVGQSSVSAVNSNMTNTDESSSAAGQTVYFDYDSFVIRPEFQGMIEATAKRIQLSPLQKLTIEGHTDERGGREYNLALGQKRSDAVRRTLALLGVPESRMESVSFGEEKPAVVESTEAALEKNRRAEISIR